MKLRYVTLFDPFPFDALTAACYGKCMPAPAGPALVGCRRATTRSLVFAVCALAAALPSTRAAAAIAPRLGGLIDDAERIVVGSVTKVTPYDDRRALVVEVAVEKTLRGEAAGTDVAIAAMRRFPSQPLPCKAGERGVIFLRVARLNSYLRKTLPPASYHELVGDWTALVVSAAPQEAGHIASLVERLLALESKVSDDAAASAAAERGLVFDLIASQTPLLVEDGAASLKEIPQLAGSLTADEQRRLESAIGRDDLPRSIRVSLIEAVATAGLRQLVPALRKIESPEMLAASWQALADLGSPVDEKGLANDLADSNPELRAAAARELLKRQPAEAIGRAAPLALSDPDPQVRVAVIEALGATRLPEALPTLERAFNGDSPEIRQAATRAVVAIGGRPAVESLGRLAFSAPDEEAQRYAVAAFILLKVPPDDPVLRRIAETHPNPSVRELAEKGPRFPAH